MNERNRWRPGRLAIVRWQGTDYFMDERMRQFRDVDDPHHFVEFDSPEGKRMLREGKLIREHD